MYLYCKYQIEIKQSTIVIIRLEMEAKGLRVVSTLLFNVVIVYRCYISYISLQIKYIQSINYTVKLEF